MVFYGPFGYGKRFSNFAAAHARGNQPQDLDLARGQRFDGFGRRKIQTAVLHAGSHPLRDRWPDERLTDRHRSDPRGQLRCPVDRGVSA